MPAATIVTLADAIVELLRERVVEEAGEIERNWLVREKLEDQEQLRVDVVPMDDQRDRASRNQWHETFELEICVRQRVGQDQDAQAGLSLQGIDAKAAFVEDLAQVLQDSEELLNGTAVNVGVRIATLGDRDILEQCRQFWSLIEVSYKMRRSSS